VTRGGRLALGWAGLRALLAPGFALQVERVRCQNGRMPKKPEPVPWGEVADMSDDLTAWLINERRLPSSAAKQPSLSLAKDILRGAAPGSLAARVAGSVIVLERYQAAGARSVEGARRRELSAAARELLYNDKLERDADKVILNLSDRISRVRQLVDKIGLRQENRLELLLRDKNQERMEALQAANRVAFAALRDDLAVFDDAIDELQASFHQFNQARTVAPLTLGGWQSLRRKIKASLVAAGFPWPEESSRRSRVRATKRKG